MNLGIGDIGTDIVRIDSIVWSQNGTDELIGFLYHLHNGTNWVSSRKSANITDAGLAQFTAFLDAVRVRPNTDYYPPTRQDNGATQYEVRNVGRNLSAFHLYTKSCVVWPPGKELF